MPPSFLAPLRPQLTLFFKCTGRLCLSFLHIPPPPSLSLPWPPRPFAPPAYLRHDGKHRRSGLFRLRRRDGHVAGQALAEHAVAQEEEGGHDAAQVEEAEADAGAVPRVQGEDLLARLCLCLGKGCVVVQYSKTVGWIVSRLCLLLCGSIV